MSDEYDPNYCDMCGCLLGRVFGEVPVSDGCLDNECPCHGGLDE
jgi:hypothetical protein